MNRKLRWGILSTSSIAQSAVMPGIHQSERGEIVAIASRDADKAADVAVEFNIQRSYGTYEELLADENVDAVYIPLPNHLHKEWTIAAAKAGKHILCEKPVALNADEAAEMVDVCQREGVIFAEAFMYRYHPKHARVKEIIASGEIGEIRALHANFTCNNSEDLENVRYKKAMGGGSIYDVGCYPISMARMILGHEPTAATVHAFFSPEHDDVDMMASGMLEFPGSIALTFDCGLWAFSRCYYEVLGTKGSIELPNAFGWERTNEPPQILVHTSEGSREERGGVMNSFSLEADAFADAVLDGIPLPYSPEDAVNNMKVIDACLHSARTSLRVKL